MPLVSICLLKILEFKSLVISIYSIVKKTILKVRYFFEINIIITLIFINKKYTIDKNKIWKNTKQNKNQMRKSQK